MRKLLADADLAGLSSSDIPPMFQEVVERGWSVTGSGARVLTDLRPDTAGSYFDRLTEETTLNGRGMTDYDLSAEPAAADERANVLLRRCLAYAAGCLRAARDHFGDDEVRAYVSLSLGGLDDDLLTAQVTFCTPLPDTAPYIADLEQVRDAAVAELSVRDCPDGAAA
ncbi:hypothetical protein [Streptomyces sp. NK15101]|uniref:hypothetical protein n=1 Tax=Streptomyces sp. NK15101 TaxID=2873261 RepID=UPI001CECBD95|nr:hypothetical protein [Streptomyces sp. NK15101]